MIIAIDFDGTIAEHAGDGIGPEILDAVGAIRVLQKRHTLILWTCRGGKWLEEAEEWLKRRGLYFSKLNENVHALTHRGEIYWPRKVFAHVYIDDQIPGGFQGWNNILELLGEQELVR